MFVHGTFLEEIVLALKWGLCEMETLPVFSKGQTCKEAFQVRAATRERCLDVKSSGDSGRPEVSPVSGIRECCLLQLCGNPPDTTLNAWHPSASARQTNKIENIPVSLTQFFHPNVSTHTVQTH